MGKRRAFGQLQFGSCLLIWSNAFCPWSKCYNSNIVSSHSSWDLLYKRIPTTRARKLFITSVNLRKSSSLFISQAGWCENLAFPKSIHTGFEFSWIMILSECMPPCAIPSLWKDRRPRFSVASILSQHSPRLLWKSWSLLPFTRARPIAWTAFFPFHPRCRKAL
jgi:hypothetical protein